MQCIRFKLLEISPTPTCSLFTTELFLPGPVLVSVRQLEHKENFYGYLFAKVWYLAGQLKKKNMFSEFFFNNLGIPSFRQQGPLEPPP